MSYSRKQVLTLIIAVVCLVLEATGSSAALHHYVQKYRHILPTQEQLDRLGRYDPYITYFTSFSYSQPGHKVNPDFIRALILAESDGYPDALSPEGARGVTQILYPTGKKAAREIAARADTLRFVTKKQLVNLKPNDLYNPAINILLACYLIAEYNAKFGGKLDLVVSAWNAGTHSIINNRPANYPETLNHIGKVNGYFLYFLRQRRASYRVVYRRQTDSTIPTRP